MVRDIFMCRDTRQVIIHANIFLNFLGYEVIWYRRKGNFLEIQIKPLKRMKNAF